MKVIYFHWHFTDYLMSSGFGVGVCAEAASRD
jgi:hypothetical protein